MDIQELLERIDIEQRHLATQVAEAELTLASLRDQYETNHQRRQTLIETADMFGLEISTPEIGTDSLFPTEESAVLWRELDRTDAVIKVLGEHAGSMSPMEVTAALAEIGRTDDYDVVGSTLAYLKKRRKVFQPERGRYRLTPDRPTFSQQATAIAAVAATVGAIGMLGRIA